MLALRTCVCPPGVGKIMSAFAGYRLHLAELNERSLWFVSEYKFTAWEMSTIFMYRDFKLMRCPVVRRCGSLRRSVSSFERSC